jgi:dTDP-4-dehydrorhamnose reductase
LRVAVIGSNGQLGSDLVEALTRNSAFEPIGVLHKDLEVSDASSCKRIAELKPEVVVNTAAFHKTDLCEDDPLRAFQVNAVGSYNVSRACSDIGAVHVYISTDYVFSGDKVQPYSEEDTPAPINVYGMSKLAGELVASEYAPKHYVIRSSSLFGRAGASGKGGNFVETVVKKATSGDEIKVVGDIIMSPTNTMDLAQTICKIVEKRLPWGTYHVANSGSCTWWEFAKEIVLMGGFKAEVKRITSSEYPTKARRPKLSALTSVRLSHHNISMRGWQDALADYLRLKGHTHPMTA